jgi:hypothetical protein
MAIAVPLLLANTAAGAAIAGAIGISATTLAVATSVVFQVTGVNDKINKAAANVFGEDLVKVANIAGIAYGAYNGGFSLDPAKEFFGIGEAASTGANVVEGLGAAPELTSASWAADGAANTAAITEAAGGVASTPSVFDKMDFAAADPNGPTDILTGKGGMIDAKEVASNTTSATTPAASSAVQPARAQTDGFGPAARTGAAGADATTSKFALTNNATTANAAQGIQANAAQGIQATTGQGYQLAGGSQPQNVFDKLMGKVGDKTIAGVIQGAAGGYSAARKAQLEAEARRVNPTTITGYTYRAPV